MTPIMRVSFLRLRPAQTSVTILSSEIAIGEDAFDGCTQLKTVNLQEGLQKDNILQTKSAFEEEDDDWFSEDEEEDF